MDKELTFADLAIQEIPFGLSPPFVFENIPIPIDILDSLLSRYIPGRMRGWADYNREEITPVRIRYNISQLQLGNIGTIDIYKTDTSECGMHAKFPPLSYSKEDNTFLKQLQIQDHKELRRKREEHQRKVVQGVFNLLAHDRTWKKHWEKAKEKWDETSEKSEERTIKKLNQIIEMQERIDQKLSEIKKGQVAIYKRIGEESQITLGKILDRIQQGRIEQNQIKNTVEAIRKTIKYLQSEEYIFNAEFRKILNDIYIAVNSDLSLNQKFELTIPIVPYLLEHKIEISAGVDLGAVWEELQKHHNSGV